MRDLVFFLGVNFLGFSSPSYVLYGSTSQPASQQAKGRKREKRGARAHTSIEIESDMSIFFFLLTVIMRSTSYTIVIIFPDMVSRSLWGVDSQWARHTLEHFGR